MSYKELIASMALFSVIVALLYGATKLTETEVPTVHDFKQFVCITYKETMQCAAKPVAPVPTVESSDEVILIHSGSLRMYSYTERF